MARLPAAIHNTVAARPAAVSAMSVLQKLKTVWVYIRSGKRYRKAVKQMAEKENIFKKAFAKSRTTQNVAVGAAAGGGAVYSLITVLRSVCGDSVPWDRDSDAAVSIVLGTIIIPAASRVIAWIRSKVTGVKPGAAAVALLCAASLAAGGCASDRWRVVDTERLDLATGVASNALSRYDSTDGEARRWHCILGAASVGAANYYLAALGDMTEEERLQYAYKRAKGFAYKAYPDLFDVQAGQTFEEVVFFTVFGDLSVELKLSDAERMLALVRAAREYIDTGQIQL